MIDYSEKRDFMRMSMECPAHYRVEGAENSESAMVRNLSAGGVLLLTDKPLEEGAEIALRVMPTRAITPPLSSHVTVLRCDETEDGRFAVACAIRRVLEEHEVDATFP